MRSTHYAYVLYAVRSTQVTKKLLLYPSVLSAFVCVVRYNATPIKFKRFWGTMPFGRASRLDDRTERTDGRHRGTCFDHSILVDLFILGAALRLVFVELDLLLVPRLRPAPGYSDSGVY